MYVPGDTGVHVILFFIIIFKRLIVSVNVRGGMLSFFWKELQQH